MVDGGKAALYIRSIMEELGYQLYEPTELGADNSGARHFSNAQQPTKRTRHMDLKHFALLQWTEDELLYFPEVPTHLNIGDSISKPVSRIKHHEQNDILMGRRRPQYSKPNSATTTKSSLFSTSSTDLPLPELRSVGGCED